LLTPFSSHSFYYSTAFLTSTGAISDPFLTSMIFTIVNVCSTPISFWTVERFGRRPLRASLPHFSLDLPR